MASVNKQTKLFKELIAKLEPELRKAFLLAIQGIKDRVVWKDLIAALANGNIPAAIEAMGITREAFYSYQIALAATYAQSGAVAAAGISGPLGGSINFLFNMANPRAEAWLLSNGGEKITNLLIPSLREAIMSKVAESYEIGNHPFTIARSLIGNVVNGKRSGGLLGLSEPQMNYVESMRARLQSGSSSEIQKILSGMTLRDKRFDGLLGRVQQGEASLTAKNIEDMLQSYTNKLLKRRGEDVARTETAMAVMSSRKESMQQALEKLGYPDSAVIKTWRHGGGPKDPRPHHVIANNKQVRGLNVPFILANGAVMQHSHDQAGGAGEVVNCTCDTTIRIDHSWNLT